MYDLVINELAEQEYAEAAVWYQEQGYGLGDRFRAHVLETIQVILKNPQLFNITHKDFHEAVVDVFPFIVVYYVNERTKTVHISAIFHTSRNPRFKFRKPE